MVLVDNGENDVTLYLYLIIEELLQSATNAIWLTPVYWV